MASNPPEPSSSSGSPNHSVPDAALTTEEESYCEVSYVNGTRVEDYQEEQFIHLKAEERLSPSVNYEQFSDPSCSAEAYVQVSLQSYGPVNNVSTSSQNTFHETPGHDASPESFSGSDDKKPVMDAIHDTQIHSSCGQSQEAASTEASASVSDASILALHEEAVDSQQNASVQDAEVALQRVALTIDPITLQHLSVVHPNVPGLGLPVLLDRNSLAALLASTRVDSTLSLEASPVSRSVISSQGLQRTLLAPEQSQFYASDAAIATIAHSLLSPVLSQKDVLPSVIASSSCSTPTVSHISSSNYPINHKQLMAQKYAAELEAPSTSANLTDMREQNLLGNIQERVSSPYVVPSTAGTLLDTHAMAVYSDPSSSMPSTSASQCLPVDVYAIDRGVAQVSSTRDSPDNLLNGDVQFTSVSHDSSHASVQNYVSSSVDLVHTSHIDHGMHCAVDSTVGPKLHQNDESVVDSSDGYSHVDTSADSVLHTTTRGDYPCSIRDINSCDEAVDSNTVAPVLNGVSPLETNEALSSSTGHGFSSHEHISDAIIVHDNGDDIQSCSTVSSATHPDSTRSPIGMGSQNPVLSSELSPGSPLTVLSQHPRPKRDLKSSRHWCEDCCLYYEKECPHHRIQLIFDKPVLSRAWASLPATYLYVNKIGINEEGDPEYGVFAKKTIPKRTQFGPVEGVLVKREDPPSEHFILLIEHEDGVPLYLDTSDESMSNWMRFVRPADTIKEQNLVLVQHGNSLYFNTTRSINPKSELRVWYSSAYAQKWGLPVLETNEEERKALKEQENEWPCFECNQRFATSEELQKHLNQHDEETDGTQESAGPRTRNRTKARNRVFKKGHATSRLRAALETLEEATTQALPPSKRPRGRPPKKHKVIPKQEDFKCEICYKTFPRNYSLQRHLIMHSGEKKYKCPICDMKFSHVYNRNRHVRRHKQRDDELPNAKPAKPSVKKKQGAEWDCTHCDLTFHVPSVLNLHILTHAAEDVGLSDSCQFNEGHVITKDGFESMDVDSCKVDDGSLHKCPECTQEFVNKRDLIEHASVHGKLAKQRCYRGIINPLKPYKCNLCYKSFASDERLIRHYLVHGSEDSKPLQCDICFKRFLNNSALACHIKVHSEERKFYECPICKTEFEQIVALKEHVHIHCHDGVYSCPNCQKVFEEYNQIRKHIRAFHSERRYPCDKCEKVFPRPDKLKLHMLRHSDHREFLCANCGKQFKRKDKLKEHMKRMHAPEREAKINARNSRSSGSKKFVPKVSPTDYHRFIYKCHACLLGFKRRGMLVNHLAKRHPDIRPESVPELNLPILKTTRDYYCQYCEKVYKSSSKRKAHILKNHPGAELPMSNRRKGGIPEIPGVPNPTFSQTVGSITTHPHHCSWCHKQYASKAKLLQHQRKKHMDMLALTYVSSGNKTQAVCDQATQVTGQIVIAPGVTASGIPSDATVVIDASKGKIRYVDKDTLVVAAHPDGLPTADLLTQAMSELTQNLEFRSPGDFLATRLTESSAPILVNNSPSATPVPTPPSPNTSTITTATSTSNPASPSTAETTVTSAAIDQIQLNQLLAQYQQPVSPQHLAAVVVTPVSRSWPATVTTTQSNYPAR